MTLPRHLDAQYWEGLKAFDADAAAQLQELSTAFWRERGEDLLYSKKTAALAALSMLERVMHGAAPAAYARALLRRYELLQRLKRWPDIVALREARRADADPQVLKYHEAYYTGVAQWHLKRPEAARELLRQVPPDARPSMRKEAERLLALSEAALPGAAAPAQPGAALELALDADALAAREAIVAHYAARGVTLPPAPLNEILALAPLVLQALPSHAGNFAGSRRRPFRAPAGAAAERPQLVFVGGFGWSGSGAVSDYLGQFEEVGNPFGHREVTWLQGRQNLVSVFDCLCRPFDAQVVAHFVYGGLLGLPVGPTPPTAEERSYLHTHSMLGRSLGDGLAAERVLPLVTALLERLLGARDGRQYKDAFVTLVLDWLGLYAQGRRFLVVNNGLMAFRFALGKYLPGARFIYVQRNLLDVYCSRRIEAPPHDTAQTPEAFARLAAQTLRHYDRACDEHRIQPGAGALLELRFEDFVADEAVRQRVLHFLGLEAATPRSDTAGLRLFSAATSARNIGIHRRFRQPAEVAELSQHLKQHARLAL